MRDILLIAICSVGVTQAAWGDHVETRELLLDASALSQVDIDAGAGDLTVTGDKGISEIIVIATIQVPGRNADKARAFIEKEMRLTLTADGDRAKLDSHFETSNWNWGDHPAIDLNVRIPARLGLRIDDGSGPMRVENVDGDIRLDDGSGSIALEDAGGSVTIDDGSGSMTVGDVNGELRIADGSGSIRVDDVAGDVHIEDGSGSIKVGDVGGDLVVARDSSGSVRYGRVQGRVDVPE